MNEQTNNNEIKQVIEEYNLSDNGEYKYYEFFKNHPGILLTFVSAIVAIIGFINRTVQYSNFSNYLSFWGWDNISIEDNPDSISYILAFSIMNLSIIFFAGWMFFKYIEPHLKISFVIAEINKRKKELNGDGFDEKETSVIDSKQLLSDELKTIVLRITIALLTVWVLFALNFALFYHYSIQLKTVLASFSFATVVVAVFAVICSVYSHKEVTKQIDAGMKEGDNKGEKAMDVLSDYLSRGKENNIFKTITRFSLKKMFTIKSILCILSAVVMILFLSVITSSLLVTDTSDKREFAVLSMDSENYMIVYNNQEVYYLNKIDIQNNILYVHTDEHKIVFDDNVDVKDMYFEYVERVRKQ
ncbi:MAG: hypothetical protein Q4E54_08165 [Lachnospiraceae bacterium]|nr:hypothetical protein [Lachnospiraceae bacterium]